MLDRALMIGSMIASNSSAWAGYAASQPPERQKRPDAATQTDRSTRRAFALRDRRFRLVSR